jgi:3-hydroxyacyl-[acyl-carrier-protein] dehydratase
MAGEPVTVLPIDVAPDHPAFEGHFPGAPVLPGAALLAAVLRAAGARAHRGWTVEQVKFVGPVGPGSRLACTLVPTGTRIDFEVRHGARLVALGRLGAPQAEGAA